MAKGRERGRRIEGQKLFTLIVWILIAGSGLADSGAESVAQELYNLRPITTASWRVDENYFYFRSLSENPYVAGLIESAAATNELSGIERELVVGVTCTVDRNTLEPQAYALYGRALKNVNPSEWAVRYQDEKERTAPEKGIESEYVAPKAILAAPMAIPAQYVIPAPTLPVEDLSDVFGNRVLALLTRQAERDLIWLEQQGQWNASYDFGFLFAMNPASLSYSGTYQLYQVGNCALMFTILSLFGTEDEVSGRSREELAGMALGLIRAKAQTHPVINSDSNGEVTIMMTGKNAMPPDYSRAYYASKEHETLAAPQLTLSSEIEIEMETTADSYVRDYAGTLRDTNYGTETGLHLVHQAADKTIKAYMRFTLADQLKPVGETTLSLVYSTGANFEAGETVLHSIYGLDDGTAGETIWSETDITWNNAPGNDADLGLTNATLLGTITVIGDNAVGTTYTLSSSELSAFLNADSNGEITIIMVPGTLQTEWAGYASKEHGIYAAPRLSVSVPMGPIITFR